MKEENHLKINRRFIISAKLMIALGIFALIEFAAVELYASDSGCKGKADKLFCKLNPNDPCCTKPPRTHTTDSCTVNSKKHSMDCRDGNVYYRDNCGGWQDVAKNCPDNSSCRDAECVCNDGFTMKTGQCCAPQDSKVCVENNVYWKDSCGAIGELAVTCPENSTCNDAVCACNHGYEMNNGKCVKTSATIAFTRFRNNTGNNKFSNLTESLSMFLSASLLKTDNYFVLSPSDLDLVQSCPKNLEYHQYERWADSMKKLDVDFLITGAITEAGTKMVNGDTKFYLSADIELIDVETGKSVFSCKILKDRNIDTGNSEMQGDNIDDAIIGDLIRQFYYGTPDGKGNLVKGFHDTIIPEINEHYPAKLKRKMEESKEPPEPEESEIQIVEPPIVTPIAPPVEPPIKPITDIPSPSCNISDAWNDCIVMQGFEPPKKNREMYPAFYVGYINKGANRNIKPWQEYYIFIDGQLVVDRNGVPLCATVVSVADSQAFGYINQKLIDRPERLFKNKNVFAILELK